MMGPSPPPYTSTTRRVPGTYSPYPLSTRSMSVQNVDITSNKLLTAKPSPSSPSVFPVQNEDNVYGIQDPGISTGLDKNEPLRFVSQDDGDEDNDIMLSNQPGEAGSAVEAFVADPSATSTAQPIVDSVIGQEMDVSISLKRQPISPDRRRRSSSRLQVKRNDTSDLIATIGGAEISVRLGNLSAATSTSATNENDPFAETRSTSRRRRSSTQPKRGTTKKPPRSAAMKPTTKASEAPYKSVKNHLLSSSSTLNVNSNLKSQIEIRKQSESPPSTPADSFLANSAQAHGEHPLSSQSSPPPTLVPTTIAKRAGLLFPDLENWIRQTPCLSARLFAAWTLRQDCVVPSMTAPQTPEIRPANNDGEEIRTTKPMTRRRRRQQQETGLSQSYQEVLPLLKALVGLEISTLLSSTDDGEVEESQYNTFATRRLATRTKSVHFSGFDGSAMKPPVDEILESDDHARLCISKLHEVVEEVHALTVPRSSEAEPSTNNALSLVEGLIAFLKQLTSDDAKAISESIDNFGYDFPVGRLTKAAKYYVHDLEILVSRLCGEILAAVGNSNFKPMHMEQRLADWCGQMIRYLLRSMFNPIPNRAHYSPKALDLPPRILDLVSLQFSVCSDDLNVDNELVVYDDCPLSYLVSHALRSISECFGPTALSDVHGVTKQISEDFLRLLHTSEVISFPLDSSHDYAGLNCEIVRIGSILSAFRGARFLHELWISTPVSEAFQHKHHGQIWNDIQRFASMMMISPATPASNKEYLDSALGDWFSVRSEDQHLVIFGQFSQSELIERLGDLIEVMDPLQTAAHQRFECWKDGFKLLKSEDSEETPSPSPRRRRRSSAPCASEDSLAGSQIELEHLRSTFERVRESIASFPTVLRHEETEVLESPSSLGDSPQPSEAEIADNLASPGVGNDIGKQQDIIVVKKASSNDENSVRQSPRLLAKKKSKMILEADAVALLSSAETCAESSEGENNENGWLHRPDETMEDSSSQESLLSVTVENNADTSPAIDLPSLPAKTCVGDPVDSLSGDASEAAGDNDPVAAESSASIQSSTGSCSKSPPFDTLKAENDKIETPKLQKRARRSTPKRGLMDTPMVANQSRRRSKRLRRSSLVDPLLLAQNTVLLPPSTLAVTAANVTTWACSLFPNKEFRNGIQELPCISARLFACFSLRQETEGCPSPLRDQEGSCADAETGVASKLGPLMPLLQAIVNLELVTLSSGSEESMQNKKKRAHENSTRKVHFSGFDGSSMKPPVDVLPGSDSHQLACLNAHSIVIDEIQRLQNDNGGAITIEFLQRLTSFLKSLSVEDAAVCSESILWGQKSDSGLSFPPSRILKASKLYLQDLEILITRLSGASAPQLLMLEQRLADSCGQLIRHHLRDIFNPVPCRATFILSGPRARRISEYVHLQSIVDSEAADDGCLSSLVSYALRGICELLGMPALTGIGLDAARPLDEIVANAVPSRNDGVSESGINKLRRWLEGPGEGGADFLADDHDASSQEKITEDEWEAVFSEVWQLGEVLSVFHGARFLFELFTATGVAGALEHGEHRNSWNALQSHAEMLAKSSRLSNLRNESQPWASAEDAHLAILAHGSIEDFVGRLVEVVQHLEPYLDECVARLKEFVDIGAEGAKMCLFSPKRKKSKRRSSSGRRSCVYNAMKQETAAIFYKTHKNELDALVALVEEVKQRSSFFPKVISLDDDEEENEDFVLEGDQAA